MNTIQFFVSKNNETQEVSAFKALDMLLKCEDITTPEELAESFEGLLDAHGSYCGPEGDMWATHGHK